MTEVEIASRAQLKRIRRETSNSDIEELLKNLVKSLETIQNTLNDHEVRARQGVAKFLELTFSCIHTRI